MKSKIFQNFLATFILIFFLALMAGGIWYLYGIFSAGNNTSGKQDIPKEKYSIREMINSTEQIKLADECENLSIDRLGLDKRTIDRLLSSKLEYNFLVGAFACGSFNLDELNETREEFNQKGDQCFSDYSLYKPVIDEASLLLNQSCSDNNLSKEEFDRLIKFLEDIKQKGLLG